MGTTNRAQPWKYGDIKPVQVNPPIQPVVISRGDLVARASGSITGATSAASITASTPYPASDQPWDTDLATTQTAFVAKFVGVSQDAMRKDLLPVPLTVATKGVHEFNCASATFGLGDLVGPAKQSGNLLSDQTLVAVGSAALAIGRVAKEYQTATTTILVDVKGVILP